MRRREAIARELPIRTVLRNYKAAVARGVLNTWTLTASIVVVILISPSLLESLFHIAPRISLQANLAGCAALCLSVLAVGAATDRFGIRRVSIVMSTRLIIGVYGLYIGAERMLSALMGFCIFAGIGGAVLTPIALVAAFPPALRFTGVSVSYSAEYAVFGGVTPIVESWLVHLSPLGAAHYVAAATIVGVVSTVTGWQPESLRRTDGKVDLLALARPKLPRLNAGIMVFG
jgi:hypothetical protein